MSLEKLYFRIGEVASIVGVEPHVLRYWESEFRSIRPLKSAKGQRIYSRRDVETLQKVKELLYAHRFTIAGAKRKLREGGIEPVGPEVVANATEVQVVREQLLEVREECRAFLGELDDISNGAPAAEFAGGPRSVPPEAATTARSASVELAASASVQRASAELAAGARGVSEFAGEASRSGALSRGVRGPSTELSRAAGRSMEASTSPDIPGRKKP